MNSTKAQMMGSIRKLQCVLGDKPNSTEWLNTKNLTELDAIYKALQFRRDQNLPKFTVRQSEKKILTYTPELIEFMVRIAAAEQLECDSADLYLHWETDRACRTGAITITHTTNIETDMTGQLGS